MSGTERHAHKKITVVGIGNTLMGDDGVGVLVAEELLGRLDNPNVEVVIGAVAGMGLIRHFRESDVVLVIDAIDIEGAEAGAIFKFDPDEAGVTELRSNNIHGMGVSYLVTNARFTGADPAVTIFGIQVGDVRQNDRRLTPEVEAASRRVKELVIEELESLGAAVAAQG